MLSGGAGKRMRYVMVATGRRAVRRVHIPKRARRLAPGHSNGKRSDRPDGIEAGAGADL